MKQFIILILSITSAISLNAQIENISIANPVYDFLLRAEGKGLLPHYSLSQLPWQKQQVVSALKLMSNYDSLLSNNERKTLNRYLEEFGIIPVERAVVFYSDVDTLQVLSHRIIGDFEKNIYHYSDSNSNITFTPLGSIEGIFSSKDNGSNLAMGTMGFRLFGTLSDRLGYELQVTNSARFAGDSSLALMDYRYANSKNYTLLHKNADISESHIAYKNDWFIAKIGRENRLSGAGLNQRLLINNWAPAFDALTLIAKFHNFEYSFSHNSLLNIPISNENTGFATVIPNKYMAMHTFTLLPSWGELTFFETVIYSRDLALAYLNPLSFFKTLEHSEHDRDNTAMGLSSVYRPFRNLAIKGTWFLDDIKIVEIGTGYWSNKTAWNIAAITTAIDNIDVGIEYSRVEPYTYSHYNSQNSNTNDGVLFGSFILPNSDRWNLFLQYWYGQRYPLKLNVYYTRHGKNIYDSETGELLVNVGGDPMQSLRWTEEIKDNEKVTFLDGDLEKIWKAEISTGQEILRGLSIHQLVGIEYNQVTDAKNGYIRLIIRLGDF